MKESRIMIVEDEAVVARDLQMQLKGFGYDTSLLATSGEDAVYTALEFKPDLILMDIVLPGEIDGIEAAHRIHSRSHVPVIYLTAYADNATIERAKLTGPFGYLQKPIREKELRSTIEMSLHKYNMEVKLFEDIRELERYKHYLLKLIEELKENNALLKEEVAGRKEAEDRNNMLLMKAQRSSRELRKFARMVADNLQITLNAVITLSDWLYTDHGSKLNEEGREELGLLVKSVNVMSRWVNHTFDYLERGRDHHLNP